ncbi:MAG: 2-phospho-L-lactate transferase [Acidimicrobiaceae bacterium]|nr:2-phospho-L-lactate transferase [Acidimicrobiaceae bacterium]
MITVLAGGVGAARYLTGQLLVTPAADVTAVVNVADDVELHGLHVSPDIDTVIYTLSGVIDRDRGWGLADETWNALGELRALGLDAWFNLGDRDIGNHLFRTTLLHEGLSFSEVTAHLASARGLGCRVLPVSDQRIETRVTLASGDEIGFQEYFVRLAHDVPISGVRFAGVDDARPAPGVLDAIAAADVVVIAPSNPVVSIGPVLAVRGVAEALAARRERNVAVSPIVAGAARKGPADRMLRELGEESSVVGVARRYREVVGTLVIDEADAALAPAVADVGVRAVVAPTIMSSPEAAAELARRTIAAVAA